MTCIGEWCSRGKTIKISDRGGQMILEMGPGSPALPVISIAEGYGNEAWPMKWAAVRVNPDGGPLDKKDAVYLLELAEPSSTKLLVRKPIGDSVIEFLRAGTSTDGAPAADTAAGVTTLAIRGSSRSRSRSRSADTRGKGGVGNFLPGDWNCPRCGEHQFARNLSCRTCSASKPGGMPDPAVGHGNREALVMKVKRGQRESQSFKQRWWDYCDRLGRGFYDPARHDVRFLEEFLATEKRGGSGSSRSGSASRSRSRSDSRPSSDRSRSRSKSRRRKRRKGKRARSRRRKARGRKKRRARSRHRRGKKEKARKKHRKRSHSRSESSADSGGSASASTSKEAKEARKVKGAQEAQEAKASAALKDAEAAVAAAEQALEKAKEAVRPDSAVFIRAVEEARNEDVLRRVELAKVEADEGINAQLKEFEAKLLDEKVTRLTEAEQKLDKAVASRLKEAERRLKKEADIRFEEEKRLAEEAGRTAVEDAKRQAQATSTQNVEDVEARLKELQERLLSLRGGKPEKAKPAEKKRKKACSSSEAEKDEGSGESSSGSSAGSSAEKSSAS